ncbi:MAG: DUF2796 domain-containing protein [Gammaproteobacteria bacterium]|nr:DUF2796 domain-containing protein [Gammaproteobacteria bacterium]NIM73122.1 DUF2796 domain-containing protein [Gammaproteobacteria bacterium]NIN38802.1 DUF2796 domain-containing protein [Gammaproteobacteria bacterium]NIO24877.1 DUF2796 domain-containing protein [Gammaproteobacteria bacterium]NIO65479.1 DUF2796 domain-containing protein [Gammaproteobacteria bacterium]
MLAYYKDEVPFEVKRSRKKIFAFALAAVFLNPVHDITASEAGHREHDAHSHGSGLLNVVVADNELVIELEIPAVNVIGFEHAPRSDEERRAVRNALETFERADSLFVPTGAAKCRAEHVDVSLAGMQHGNGDEQGHEHESQSKAGDETHSELHGEYHFHCDAPEKLDSLQVRLFENLMEMDEIDVQLVTPTNQTVIELHAEAAELKLSTR